MKGTIVGERIRTRRKDLKLNQSQLAEMAGYSDKTAISRIENGENDLNQSKIVMFAEVLQTTPSYLMGWTDVSAKEIPENKGKPIKHADIQSAYDHADERTKKAVRIMLGLE